MTINSSKFVSYHSDMMFVDYLSSMRSDLRMFTDEMKVILICKHCQIIPKHALFDEMRITFTCKCSFKWNVCLLCNLQNQPSLLKKTVFKKKKAVRQKLLEDNFLDHMKDKHDDLRDQGIASNDDTCFSSSGISVDGGCDDVSDIQNEDYVVGNDEDEQSRQTLTCAPTKDEMYTYIYGEKSAGCSVEAKNERNVEMVLKNVLCPNFPEYIIKENWLHNHHCVVVQDDVLLFYKVLKRLVLQSRDQNSEFMDVFDLFQRKTERIEKDMSKKIVHMDNEIHRLRLVQEKLKTLIRTNASMNDFMMTELSNILNLDKTESLCVDIEDCFVNKYVNTTSVHVSIPIPRNMKEARSLIEGKKCLLSYLIVPTVNYMKLDCQAYCQPSECLKLAINSGITFEEYTSYNSCKDTISDRSIFHSQRIRELVSNNQRTDESMKVVIGLWSDGCEAGGMTKGIRSSVKLTTIHLCHECMNENYVFPVALGKGKSEHENVRRILWKNIEDLCNKEHQYYDMRSSCVRRVEFTLGYLIQDRPEHSEWTGFMSHSGTYSTVPGVSFPCQIFVDSSLPIPSNGIQVQKSLASCMRCFLRRKRLLQIRSQESGESFDTCSECNDWNLHEVKYKPHKDYPKDSPHYQEWMMSKVITFTSMRQSADIIHSKIYHHKWTKVKAERFAQVECLKTHITEVIYKDAVTTRPRRDDLMLNENDEDERRRFPINVLPIGMTQTNILLKDCMLGVMHTLVLNLGRHLLCTIKDLLCEHNCWTAGYERCNYLFVKVRGLSLSWCKAWNFGSRDAPGSSWVSENYLGFAVCSKMFMSEICSDSKLDLNIGKCIKDCLCAYNSVIACCMQDKYQSHGRIMIVRGHIKIFLSMFLRVDSLIVSRSISKIESASCLLNLLLINDDMFEKGILRNYWEGDLKGEGFIRLVKPLIKRGIDLPGTIKSVLQRLYNLRSINHLIDLCQGTNIEEEESDEAMSLPASGKYQKDRYRRFKSYPSKNEAITCLERSDPFCLMFRTSTSHFHMSVGRGSSRKLWRITLKYINEVDSTTQWDIEVMNEFLTFEVSTDFISDFTSCICLPMHALETPRPEEENESPQRYYCVRNEHHMELNSVDPVLFKYPSVHFSNIDTSALDTQRNECVPGISEDVEYKLSDFNDPVFCKQWVNESVPPLGSYECGKVSSFHYKLGLRQFENCVWTIKYFSSTDTNARAKKVKKVEYNELRRLLTSHISVEDHGVQSFHDSSFSEEEFTV